MKTFALVAYILVCIACLTPLFNGGSITGLDLMWSIGPLLIISIVFWPQYLVSKVIANNRKKEKTKIIKGERK